MLIVLPLPHTYQMRKGRKLLVGGLQLIHLLLALLRHAAQIDFRHAAARVDVLSNDS